MESILTIELERLRSRLEWLEQLQPKPPAGLLVCVKKGNAYSWLVENKKTGQRKYLRKEFRRRAEALALKSYLRRAIPETEKMIRCIENALKHAPKDSAGKLLQNPAYRDLLRRRLNLGSADFEKWKIADYPKYNKYPEGLINKTGAGVNVRSKSEALIGTMLENAGIDYRYECLLNIGTKTYAPDFTIFDKKNSREVIWEHFGMMNDLEYMLDTTNKLTDYFSYGYIPFDNMICTFETKNKPLNTSWVMTIINYFFL